MASSSASGGEARLALTAGLACYLIWGVVPLVFQLVGRLGANPWEILANRTVWAAPTAFVLVLAARQGRHALEVLRTPRTLAALALSALLVGMNWSIFIWAVNSGRVLETSLGYYIVPLLNMAAGAAIFRERLNRSGLLAIGCAAAGVALQTAALGRLPVTSLVLALSFSLYGVVRKRVRAEAQTGLLVECLLLATPGLAYVIWLQASGHGHLTASPGLFAGLVATGPITAVPLLLFAWAARRIPLSAMGFLQFITPTMSFAIGVAEGEPFTWLRGLSFAMIWAGVAVFALGLVRRGRGAAPASAEPTAAE